MKDKKSSSNGKMASSKEIAELLEQSRDLVYPDAYDEWEEYVIDHMRRKDKFYAAIIRKCVEIMRQIDELPSPTIVMLVAKEAEESMEGYALSLCRGIAFNFFKYGAEFALALECAKVNAKDANGNREPSDVTISQDNIQLIIEKMFKKEAIIKELTTKSSDTISETTGKKK